MGRFGRALREELGLSSGYTGRSFDRSDIAAQPSSPDRHDAPIEGFDFADSLPGDFFELDTPTPRGSPTASPVPDPSPTTYPAGTLGGSAGGSDQASTAEPRPAATTYEPTPADVGITRERQREAARDARIKRELCSPALRKWKLPLDAAGQRARFCRTFQKEIKDLGDPDDRRRGQARARLVYALQRAPCNNYQTPDPFYKSCQKTPEQRDREAYLEWLRACQQDTDCRGTLDNYNEDCREPGADCLDRYQYWIEQGRDPGLWFDKEVDDETIAASHPPRPAIPPSHWRIKGGHAIALTPEQIDRYLKTPDGEWRRNSDGSRVTAEDVLDELVDDGVVPLDSVVRHPGDRTFRVLAGDPSEPKEAIQEDVASVRPAGAPIPYYGSFSAHGEDAPHPPRSAYDSAPIAVTGGIRAYPASTESDFYRQLTDLFEYESEPEGARTVRDVTVAYAETGETWPALPY